jgi:hypothetical protein
MCIQLLFNILLIVGAATRTAGLVLVFLVVQGIGILGCFILASMGQYFIFVVVGGFFFEIELIVSLTKV